MFDKFLSKADELMASGERFAVALVVRAEAPISGKPGDKAIIFEDGKIWGWIGGGCAQPVVVKEGALAFLFKRSQTTQPQLFPFIASSARRVFFDPEPYFESDKAPLR
jgi:xanthine/CO dehydrogenase XdhC/CoxF family maturation factor